MAEEVYICFFNKFGFCKFSTKCFRKHVNRECYKEYCEIKSCNLRHPRPCNYFFARGYCKYGEYCRYRHVKKKSDSTDKKLENNIKVAKERDLEMEKLRKDLKEKDNEIILLKEEIEKKRAEIMNIEWETDSEAQEDTGDEEDRRSEVLYEDEVLLIVQWQPGILQKFMERLKPPIETPPPKRVSEPPSCFFNISTNSKDLNF